MQVAPYIFITGGRCEEALNFYKSVLGGDIKDISRWKDAPAEMGMPADMGNRVMHSTFSAPGVSFMASDSQPTTTYGDGPISLCVSADNEADAKRVFNALSTGGKVEVPLDKAFWGALFGMFTDKYGIDWMVTCEAAS
ncbi:MAG TPA: VOC family protein [Candidatus Eremiobacteraceae bacterium]|jgi:PhnB protein